MKDLEGEKADLMQRKGGAPGSGKVGMKATSGGKSMADDSKANEDLINFLEHKLEEIEKKLSST